MTSSLYNGLSQYHDVQNCNIWIVSFEVNRMDKQEWKGVFKSRPMVIMSFTWAKNLVRRHYSTILAYFWDIRINFPFIKSVTMVLIFQEVFFTDYYNTPLDGDIDFCINLELRSCPISIPPNYIALERLRELKTQLHELLDKGFIYLSALP